MLEALRTSGKNPKQFELALNQCVHWNNGSLSRLRPPILSGFRLQALRIFSRSDVFQSA
jgi:hypothetical protein